MAMMESVELRQKGAVDFEGYYNNMCALQNTCPLAAVKMHLHERRVDLNADRIKVLDWPPILAALRINKTLDSIALRSYHQQTVEEQEEKGYTTKRKLPSILSKEVSGRLGKAIQNCLQNSPTLKKLTLQGLQLRKKDVQSIAKGIYESKSLEVLSLEQCKIGDEGLEIIVKGLKNCVTLGVLNFTGCGLTAAGAEHISKLIKFQAMKRHNEAWEESLRYRRPDLDRMSGVRRIFLNCNPLLGDQGAQHLAEALKDDLWLKALDLQASGVGDEGANALLDVLKYNTCLSILDLRQNPLITNEVLKKIMEHLIVNSKGSESEYKWIKMDPTSKADKSKVMKPRKRTKTLQSSFGKKTTIKVNTSHTRTRSASTPNKPLSSLGENGAAVGIPWRTAMRANRCKGFPPDEFELSPENDGNHASEAKYKIDYTTEDQNKHAENKRSISPTRLSHNQWKQMQVDVEDLRCRYEEECRARTKADERIVELTLMNNQLKLQLDDARRRCAILQEDAVTDHIEHTFMHFHAFLSLIQDAGLGPLISMAGLEQTTMPFYNKFVSQYQSSDGNSSGNEHAANGSTHVKHVSKGDKSVPMPLHKKPPVQGSKSSTTIRGPAANGRSARSAQTRKTESTGQKRDQVTPPSRVIPDPVMQGAGDPEATRVKTQSRFDDLYQKVMADTEEALSQSNGHHRGQGDWMAKEGLYGTGTTHAGVRLSPEDGQEDGGSSEAASQASKGSSGGRLKVEDLRDIEDLEEEARQAEAAVGTRPGTLGAEQSTFNRPDSALSHVTDQSALPGHSEVPSNQYNYSETFEHSPSDVTEEISQNLSQ